MRPKLAFHFGSVRRRVCVDYPQPLQRSESGDQLHQTSQCAVHRPHPLDWRNLTIVHAQNGLHAQQRASQGGRAADPSAALQKFECFHQRKDAHAAAGFFEVFDDLRMEPREFLPVGDRVLVPVRHWFRSKAGAELTQEITHVWQLRDARVIHVTGYNDKSQALEAVGLRE